MPAARSYHRRRQRAEAAMAVNAENLPAHIIHRKLAALHGESAETAEAIAPAAGPIVERVS